MTVPTHFPSDRPSNQNREGALVRGGRFAASWRQGLLLVESHLTRPCCGGWRYCRCRRARACWWHDRRQFWRG